MRKITIAFVAILTFTITHAFAQSGTSKAFNELTTAYFNAKNALAKDNQVQAGKDARILLDKVKAFPVSSLTPAQKILWEKNAAEIRKNAAPIVAGKDIKDQRESFKGVSYAMIRLVKGMKMNTQNVFLQHCPMAKASWLNEVEAVQNPYYGSMMYDCGDVKETILKQ